MSLLERYCPDPPEPHENGGQYDWTDDLHLVTPYDTIVTYSCDVARQFLNTSWTNYSSIYHAIFPTQIRHCEWNMTWSPYTDVNKLFNGTIFL